MAININELKELIFNLFENQLSSSMIVLGQLLLIYFAAKIFGWIFRKINQPVVIGELCIGILLGSSFLGYHYPNISNFLFPTNSDLLIHALSQIGLIMFMFIIGSNVDINKLKDKTKSVIVLSFASVLIPLFMGYVLAYEIYPIFDIKNIDKSIFSMYFGITISFTALPVLARIMHEKGLHNSELGLITITSAAIIDFIAWILLVATIAVGKSNSITNSILIFILAILYLAIMLKIVRPLMTRYFDSAVGLEKFNKKTLFIYGILIISTIIITELIGLHALFGAFLAGLVLPSKRRTQNLTLGKIENFTIKYLLPFFFIYTGFRTEFRYLSGLNIWLIVGVVIIVAVVSKILGSAIAAKLTGQKWKDSIIIGILLNTRGLIPLIVLNIGLDIEIINPEIFSILVLMAMVSTILTRPFIHLTNLFFKNINTQKQNAIINKTKYKILISIENPIKDLVLFKIADALTKKTNGNAIIDVVHIYNAENANVLNLIEYEKKCLELFNNESKTLSIKNIIQYNITSNYKANIAKTANDGGYDLLLIVENLSIFENTILSKFQEYKNIFASPDRLFQQISRKNTLAENHFFDPHTNEIFFNCKIPIGVFYNMSECGFEKILIPVLSNKDYYLIRIAHQLINNSGSQITFIDYNNEINIDINFNHQIRLIEHVAPNHISVISKKGVTHELIDQHDLIVMSQFSWKNVLNNKQIWFNKKKSILVLTK